MKIITFIGFGAFGQAVARVLSIKKDLVIRAWDVKSTGHQCEVKDAKDAVKDADLIFFAVPSQFFAQCVNSLEGVGENAILVTGTKGMDPNTNKFPFEILKERFVANHVAVLSGPMLADELNDGVQTEATIACEDGNVSERIQKLFIGTQVELKISDDVLGTAALGVFKNVFVLGLGLSDGLELGLDFKNKLVEIACSEMEIMLERLGAKKETIDTPAGMGDFLATGYSASSRNYQYGFGFAKGEIKEGLTAEGIKNIKNLSTRLIDTSNLPFFNAVKSIFLENSNPKLTLMSVIKQ